MTDEDRDEIVNQLRYGLVALAVMADDFEVEATMAKMVSFGGRASSYKVPEETATAVTAAAQLRSDAAAAVHTAVDATTDVVDDVKKAVTVDLPALPAAAAAAVTGLVAGVDINTANAAKLQAAGVKVSSLYKTAATPQGRLELSNQSGLSVEQESSSWRRSST